MNKKLAIKIAFVMIAAMPLLFLFPVKTSAVTPTIIAKCESAVQTMPVSESAYQTFVPHVNKITKISLYLKYIGGSVDTPKMGLRDGSGNDIFTAFLTGGNVDGWHDIPFPTHFTVTPNATYRLYFIEGGPSWGAYYSTIASCYGSGQAVQDINPDAKDLTFRVYGYSTATTTTPTTASTTVSAATGLKAVADESKISLSWTKSPTSGITGYYLYRSVKATSGFAKVATIAANLSTYPDNTVTKGTTYYYYLKAYKGTVLSKATSTVSEKVEKEAAAPNTPVSSDTQTSAPTVTDTSTTTDTNAETSKKTLIGSVKANYLIYLVIFLAVIVVIALLGRKKLLLKIKK